MGRDFKDGQTPSAPKAHTEKPRAPQTGTMATRHQSPEAQRAPEALKHFTSHKTTAQTPEAPWSPEAPTPEAPKAPARGTSDTRAPSHLRH